MLPNLDDDPGRCRPERTRLLRTAARDGAAFDDAAKEYARRARLDRALHACDDASDTRVNGAEDARDLAPAELRMPSAPDGATAQVRVTGTGRAFALRGGRWIPVAGARFSAAELGTAYALAWSRPTSSAGPAPAGRW